MVSRRRLRPGDEFINDTGAKCLCIAIDVHKNVHTLLLLYTNGSGSLSLDSCEVIDLSLDQSSGWEHIGLSDPPERFFAEDEQVSEIPTRGLDDRNNAR